MNLSLRTQQIIYALLVGLIFLNVPLYFLFVQPEVEADASESAKIDQARLQIRKRISSIKSLKELESKIADSHQNYNEFTRRYLFSRDNASSELIRELTHICTEAGLLKNRASYRPDHEPQFGMQRVSISLPIEGNYTNVRKFVNILESRPKFIIVDSMTLESENEGTGLIRMIMNLSTLSVAQP
jgi:Tfp pilus assembly protein PilO